MFQNLKVVEAYRLDRYDNPLRSVISKLDQVVEAYRLDRYDNSFGYSWLVAIAML